MENTCNYLNKEVEGIDNKIDIAKNILLKELELNLFE